MPYDPVLALLQRLTATRTGTPEAAAIVADACAQGCHEQLIDALQTLSDFAADVAVATAQGDPYKALRRTR